MARTKGAVSKNFKETFVVGATFGDWTLIDNNLLYKGSQNHGQVKVRCKCGGEYYVDPYSLKKGESKRCFNCGHNKRGEKHPSFTGYKEIPGSWFLRYKQSSNKKELEFSIKIEEIYKIWIKQNKKCALSGLPIAFENSNFATPTKRPSARKYNKCYNYDLICTASLDRINSKKGYTSDNIQLVHKDINMMKKEYDQDYYIKMCSLISEHTKNMYKIN